ncbi:hypothetical protein QBC41DRAFT_316401 [Cercophora samala]|uniref:Uncharacterized protein n=1 Tax=Cercophora samala TaxID=330535 RepID=A0AA40DED3_9PEZI|nr:hypothetical protein QBC41DRAFT_316401 [Cercophora samala]
MDQVGWQPNPNRRGTFDIIQSCAITIFACTWTVQHLNVPGHNDGAFKKLLRTCKWMVINVLLPEFILAHAIVEFMMALHTMAEMRSFQSKNIIVADSPSAKTVWGGFKYFINASFFSKVFCQHTNTDLEASKPEDDRPSWTITHAYFANMGGFVCELSSPLESPQASKEPTKDAPQKNMRIFTPVLGTHLAQKLDRFERLRVSEDDIKDKSKSDNFAKAVAMLQILQLLLSLIVRHIRGLPFAQLETLALAIAACGVATWIAYWYKPRAVSAPIKLELRRASEDAGAVKSLEGVPEKNQSVGKNVGQKEDGNSGTNSKGKLSDGSNGIQLNAEHGNSPEGESSELPAHIDVRKDRGDSQDDAINITEEDPSSGAANNATDNFRGNSIGELRQKTGYHELDLDDKVFESFWSVLTGVRYERTASLPERVPNDSIPTRSLAIGETHTLTYVLAFTSAVFGSLHAIAWNFQFPTPLEAMLWKVGTILSVVVPPLGLLAIPVSQTTVWDGDPGEFLDSTIEILGRMVWDEAFDLSWELRDQYNQIRRDLTRIRHLHTPQPKTESMVLYRTIFCPEKDESSRDRDARLDTLLRYIEGIVDEKQTKDGSKHPESERFTPQYLQQSRILVDLMKGKGTKKMVEEVAKTNVYPRRTMHGAVNLTIVYFTGIVYCIARLMVVAVGLSSLRSMPDGVYVMTWTKYIPSVS